MPTSLVTHCHEKRQVRLTKTKDEVIGKEKQRQDEGGRNDDSHSTSRLDRGQLQKSLRRQVDYDKRPDRKRRAGRSESG